MTAAAYYGGAALAAGAGVAYNYLRNRKRRRGNGGEGPKGPNKRRKINKKRSAGKRKNTMRTKRRKKRYKRAEVGIQEESDNLYKVVTYKPATRAKYIEWGKQPMTYEQVSAWSCASGVATSGQSKQQISADILPSSALAIGGSAMLTELFNRHSKIQNSTGPATITVDPTFATQKYNTLFLNRIRIDLEMTNQAPTTTEADIYICTRKCSEKSYEVNAAVADWTRGLTVMDAGGSTNVNSFLDTYPTMSKRFNMQWNIAAKFKVKLDAGQERRCSYKLNVKRFLDSDHWITYAGGIKGIYHEVFVVARGPTADTNNSFTAGSIATAKVKLVGVCKVTYSSTACQIYSQLHYQTNTLTSSNAALYAIADAAGTVINTEAAANYA